MIDVHITTQCSCYAVSRSPKPLHHFREVRLVFSLTKSDRLKYFKTLTIIKHEFRRRYILYNDRKPAVFVHSAKSSRKLMLLTTRLCTSTRSPVQRQFHYFGIVSESGSPGFWFSFTYVLMRMMFDYKRFSNCE